jgi:hypothetical protein
MTALGVLVSCAFFLYRQRRRDEAAEQALGEPLPAPAGG